MLFVAAHWRMVVISGESLRRGVLHVLRDHVEVDGALLGLFL